MLPFVILALFGLSMFLIGGDDVADDTGDETPDPDDTETVPVDSIYDDPEIDPETGAFLVAPGQAAQGTEGDDVFNLVEGADYNPNETALEEHPRSITIHAGDGDDTLDLSNPSSGDWDPDYLVTGSDINGEAGNDTFNGNYTSSTVSGGAGNDTFDGSFGTSTVSGDSGDDLFLGYGASAFGGDGDDTFISNEPGYPGFRNVYGGAGDDTITNEDSYHANIFGGDGDDSITTGGTTPDNPTSVYGGAGNDVIDARGMWQYSAHGDAGDDTILTSATGFSPNFYGGEGDDIFIHDAPTSNYGGVDLYGGEGSDRFEISFDESSRNQDGTENAEYEDDDLEAVGQRYMETRVLSLADFESGVDSIQIDARVDDPAYTVASASIVGGDVVLRYETDIGVNRDMIVSTGAASLTWDDVTFVGDNIPPILIPV